jgi:hypothetical protein
VPLYRSLYHDVAPRLDPSGAAAGRQAAAAEAIGRLLAARAELAGRDVPATAFAARPVRGLVHDALAGRPRYLVDGTLRREAGRVVPAYLGAGG